jgi:hypothetical protein
MVAYKAMCDLLWTLWGLIQHAKGNPADDFWAYATNRFERCRRLMRFAIQRRSTLHKNISLPRPTHFSSSNCVVSFLPTNHAGHYLADDLVICRCGGMA